MHLTIYDAKKKSERDAYSISVYFENDCKEQFY